MWVVTRSTQWWSSRLPWQLLRFSWRHYRTAPPTCYPRKGNVITMHNSKRKLLISYGEMFNFRRMKEKTTNSREIWIKMPKLINYLALNRMRTQRWKFTFISWVRAQQRNTFNSNHQFMERSTFGRSMHHRKLVNCFRLILNLVHNKHQRLLLSKSKLNGNSFCELKVMWKLSDCLKIELLRL